MSIDLYWLRLNVKHNIFHPLQAHTKWNHGKLDTAPSDWLVVQLINKFGILTTTTFFPDYFNHSHRIKWQKWRGILSQHSNSILFIWMSFLFFFAKNWKKNSNKRNEYLNIYRPDEWRIAHKFSRNNWKHMHCHNVEVAHSWNRIARPTEDASLNVLW